MVVDADDDACPACGEPCDADRCASCGGYGLFRALPHHEVGGAPGTTERAIAQARRDLETTLAAWHQEAVRRWS